MSSISTAENNNPLTDLIKPKLFFYQLIPDNSAPLYIDTNFGLLLSVQNIMTPVIKILSNCCGISLAAKDSSYMSSCVCVKCGASLPVRFNSLRDSPKFLNTTISAALPMTTLNDDLVRICGNEIITRIKFVIDRRKRRPHENWFNNLEQFNYSFV